METLEDWLEFKVLDITVAVVSFVIVKAATGEGVEACLKSG